MARQGTFDPSIVGSGWFDETAKAEGWFAADLIQSAAGVSYSLSGTAGTYTLSGQAGTLAYVPGSVAYSLSGTAGAYSLAGQSAAFTVSRSLAGSAGSYALTGQAGALTYTPGSGQVAYSLSGETGTYELAGFGGSFEYFGEAPRRGGGGRRAPIRRIVRKVIKEEAKPVEVFDVSGLLAEIEARQQAQLEAQIAIQKAQTRAELLEADRLLTKALEDEKRIRQTLEEIDMAVIAALYA